LYEIGAKFFLSKSDVRFSNKTVMSDTA